MILSIFQVRYSFRKPQSKRFKGLTNSHPQSDRLLSVDSQNIREQPRLDDICSTTRTTDQRRLNNDLSPNTIFKEIELRDQWQNLNVSYPSEISNSEYWEAPSTEVLEGIECDVLEEDTSKKLKRDYPNYLKVKSLYMSTAL